MKKELIQQEIEFKTPYNSVPDKGEVNNLPSETVPDQSMSVKEILDRYAKGLNLEGQRVPIWMGEDDDTPENFAKWDLADKQAYVEEKRIELEKLQTRFKAEQEAKKQKQAKQYKHTEIIEPEESTKPTKGKSAAEGGREQSATAD